MDKESKELLDREWKIIKPILENMDYKMLKDLYKEMVSSECPPAGRDSAIAWIHSTRERPLPSFVRFMKHSHLGCFLDAGYDHQNPNCAECKLKNRCWDRELATYWENHQTPVVSGRFSASSPNTQNLPRNEVSMVSMGTKVAFPREQIEQAQRWAELNRGLSEEAIKLVQLRALHSFTSSDECLKVFKEQILAGLEVDPKLLEKDWGPYMAQKRLEEPPMVPLSLKLEDFDRALAQYRGERMICDNEPETTKECVIDYDNVKVCWCDDCAKPVKAVFSKELTMHVCPEIAKHCVWDCECKRDDCDDEHELTELEDLVEDRTERLATLASAQSRAESGLRYSKTKRRYDKETYSDQLGKDTLNTRTISEEIERPQARIEKLQAIENPPERTVDPRDISDWLSSPVGSLQGVPKKFKTTL